jgi:retron-type reverse transcriptase
MGERLMRVIRNFWNSLKVVARQQGYHGNPFRSERGTTQGDIVSPTIFNIVVDAVVRTWYRQLESEELSDKVRANFYADDSHIYSNNADALQRAVEIIIKLFERMGLNTNPTKTKAMVCAPSLSITRISTPAYK